MAAGPQPGPGMAPPGAMGGPPGGGESPVVALGSQMIEAYMQDPSPDNKAGLAAIMAAIQKVLQQDTGGPGGGAPPPGAMQAPPGPQPM
jgi:hypothetical protein